MTSQKVKICRTCKKEKIKSDFSKDNDSADGKYYQCKLCAKISHNKTMSKIKEGTIKAF
jgi:hypothetical protein